MAQSRLDLLADADAMKFLTVERGLTREVAKMYGVGLTTATFLDNGKWVSRIVPCASSLFIIARNFLA
jgi:hypothetical protein